MNERRLYRRIERRESFASRSTAVVIALVVTVLGALYVGTEAVLAALGRGPLLVSPAEALTWSTSGAPLVPIVGVGAVVVGIVVLISAVTPGRRARHVLPSERMAIVVDDGVIAGALARDARLASKVGGDRVRAVVSRRRARVFVTPTSGIPIDTEATATAVSRTIASLAPKPPIRAVTRVATAGKVGS